MFNYLLGLIATAIVKYSYKITSESHPSKDPRWYMATTHIRVWYGGRYIWKVNVNKYEANFYLGYWNIALFSR